MCSKKHNLTAIIYDKKGHILSIGQNSYVKTHPMQAQCAKLAGVSDKIFLHAEVAAIVKLKYLDRKKAHKIVVMRYSASGEPLNAAPCKSCQIAISMAGIKNITHT